MFRSRFAKCKQCSLVIRSHESRDWDSRLDGMVSKEVWYHVDGNYRHGPDPDPDTINVPEAGMMCTQGVGTDRYPYIITRVSASGKTFWMKRLDFKMKPTGNYFGSQDWEIAVPDNLDERLERRVSLRKSGDWQEAGYTSGGYVYIGFADAYQDPHF